MNGPVVVVVAHAGVLSMRCTITHDDGHSETPRVFALSMRAAQRELTSRLRSDGYTPVGRWVTTATESTRTFREATL
jgi:acetylornithine deacetylase/succinyl-diaminopimelate desuccinylase-like protein